MLSVLNLRYFGGMMGVLVVGMEKVFMICVLVGEVEVFVV